MPSGNPSDSGHILPFIPPLVLIRIQYRYLFTHCSHLSPPPLSLPHHQCPSHFSPPPYPSYSPDQALVATGLIAQFPQEPDGSWPDGCPLATGPRWLSILATGPRPDLRCGPNRSRTLFTHLGGDRVEASLFYGVKQGIGLVSLWRNILSNIEMSKSFGKQHFFHVQQCGKQTKPGGRWQRAGNIWQVAGGRWQVVRCRW